VFRRRIVVATAGALAAILVGRAARADTLLAQGAWPPPLPQPMAPVAGPRVTLQVDNPNGRLQQYTPIRWVDVCLAPCGVAVDPRALYRVGGHGMIASDAFQLPRASGDVVVDAEVGSKAKHWTGLGLMIGGAVAGLYGLIYLETSSAFGNVDNMVGTSFRDTARNIGFTAIGIGVVLEVVGIVLFSSSTSVQVR
jgi:hypothetical protein